MRREPRSDAETIWAVIRALYEGAEATPEMLGALSDRSAAMIAKRAAEEGWRGSPDGPRTTRARRMIDRVTERIEQIRIDADSDGNRDMLRTAGLYVALLERVVKAARSVEGQREDGKARDAGIGDAHERIDRRIVELACHLADDLAADPELRLVAEKYLRS